MTWLRFKILLAFLLPIQWIFFSQISLNEQWIEYTYSQGIYPKISIALRAFIGWIPFSVAQLILVLLIAWGIFTLFKVIKALRASRSDGLELIGKTALNGLGFASIIYLCFMLLWGLNYSRTPLIGLMQLNPPELATDELEKLCKDLIKKAKNERRKLTRDEDSTLALTGRKGLFFEQADAAYEQLSVRFAMIDHKGRSTKRVAIPQTMSLLGLGGVYFPFTGEANINMDPPDFKLPFTICHEMAHQVGFASEDEANFVAFLACTQSKDVFFRYSGYFTAMRYSLNALWRSDTLAFQRVAANFSKGIAVDLEANTIYWERFDTPIDRISSAVNDLFLKANGQQEGVKSYGKMVDLLLAYRQTKKGI